MFFPTTELLLNVDALDAGIQPYDGIGRRLFVRVVLCSSGMFCTQYPLMMTVKSIGSPGFEIKLMVTLFWFRPPLTISTKPPFPNWSASITRILLIKQRLLRICSIFECMISERRKETTNFRHYHLIWFDFESD